MSTDVDPDRAIAVADAGAIGVPAVVGVRSIRTESKVVLEGDRITSTSTSTVSGVEIVGVLSIGSIVSTASVTSDGTTSTCTRRRDHQRRHRRRHARHARRHGLHVQRAGRSSPGSASGRWPARCSPARASRPRVLGGDRRVRDGGRQPHHRRACSSASRSASSGRSRPAAA